MADDTAVVDHTASRVSDAVRWSNNATGAGDLGQMEKTVWGKRSNIQHWIKDTREKTILGFTQLFDRMSDDIFADNMEKTRLERTK